MNAKKVFVCRVRICVAMGIKGNHDMNSRVGFSYSMQFLHDTHNIIKMLENIITYYFIEGIIIKRVRKTIKVVNNVCLRSRIVINSYSPATLS